MSDSTYTIVLKLDTSGLVSGASSGTSATQNLGTAATQTARDFARLEKEIARAVKDAAREIGKATKEATAIFKQAMAERSAAAKRGGAEETAAARKAANEQKALLRQIGIEAKESARVRAAAAKQAARDEKAAFASAQAAYRTKVAEEQALHARSAAGWATIKESIKGLAVAVGIAGAALGLVSKDLLSAAISSQQIKIGFDVAANSAAGGAAVYAQVREQSYRLGLSLEETAKQYSSFAISARLAGLTAGETDVIFRGVAEAGTVLHLSAERMSLALLALEQAAGKGQVQMEELKRQLGNQIPGAVEIFAHAMGVTLPVFYDMVKAGKVLATDLPKFGAELSKVFGPGLAASMKSAQAEMNRIKSALFELRAAVGEGLLEGLAQGFSGLQTALGADELKAQAREIGKELGNVLRLASEAAIFLAQNIDKIKAALILLLAVGFAGWATKLAAAIVGLSGGINTLAFVTPLAARGLIALGITAGTATIALGAIGIVLGAAAFAMQGYITAQSEYSRVQQAELADSANVLRYLDGLRGRKKKLTAEEWSLAEAITARLRAEETAANANTLKALYALNEAKREAVKVSSSRAFGVRGDYSAGPASAAYLKVKELEQAYEDAKGKGAGFRGELTRLDGELNRLGHSAKKTATDTEGLSKGIETATRGVEKQIRALERLAEAKRAESTATIAGGGSLRNAEREAFIADKLAAAYDRMDQAKGKLSPGTAAIIERTAGALFDETSGATAATAAFETLRSSSDAVREAKARLADQLSGTETATRQLSASMAFEAATRDAATAAVKDYVVESQAEQLSRLNQVAAIENQIRASQRERESQQEVAEAAARVTDARHNMTAASEQVAAAIEIENLRIEASAPIFSRAWQDIVRDVEARRARIKVLTAEEALLSRQAEFARRAAAQRADFADFRQQADAAKKYGSAVAGILTQYGLLSDATRELGIQERALAIAKEQKVKLDTDAGRAALAVLVAEQRGYEDAIDAVSRLQVQQELLADTLQPLKDAWASVGRTGQEVLVDLAVDADVNFKEIANSLERELVGAILEVLRRWVLAEYVKRAEAIKTAAISRAAVAASGGSGGSRLTDVGSYSTFFQGGGAAAGTSGASTAGVSGSTLAAAGFAALALYIIYVGFIRDTSEKFAQASTKGAQSYNGGKSAKLLSAIQATIRGIIEDVGKIATAWDLVLKDVGDVTLGKYGKTYFVKDLENTVGRGFDSAEKAIEYAKVRAIQLGEVSAAAGALVISALKNSRAVTLDELKSDIDFGRLLQSAGLDSSLAELQSQLARFIADFAANWKRAIDLFSRDLPALAQALNGVGLLEVSSWQAARDQITGRQRSEAESLKLQQAQAAMWNAEIQLRRANIAVMLVELRAKIALLQLRATGDPAGNGSGGSGNRGPGEGAGNTTISGILAFSTAMVTTAKVAVTSAAVMTGAATTQLDALNAQLAALVALQQALDAIPLIDLGEIIPRGGGRSGGGNSRADDAKTLKEFFEQLRLSRLSEVGRQLADINKRFEDARKLAHGNAEELARLNEERAKEIALLIKNLNLRARDFLGKGGDLGASLRGVDDQVGDLIKSYRELRDKGEISLKTLRDMVAALKAEAAARRQAIVQSAFNDVLLSLLDATGRTTEAALLRWQLSILEYKLKIEELKIAVEKYRLEGFNIGLLQKLLGELEAAGPPVPGAVLPPEAGGPSNQDIYRQRLEEQRDLIAKAREDALALLKRYQDDQLDPFQKALRDLAADFQKIRAVLGDTQEVMQAYNAALLSLIEDEVRPIQEWLNQFDLGGDRGLNAQDQLAAVQQQYQAAFAAVQGGDYTRIEELMRLADEMVSAQGAINPQQSQAYRDFVTQLRAQIAALQAQILAAANQGQVLGGGTGAGGGPRPPIPPGYLPPGVAPGGSCAPGGGTAPPSAWVDPVVGALERTSGLILVKLGQIAANTAGTQSEVRRVGDILERSPLRVVA